MTREIPPKLTDWKGQEWTPGCGRLAAHPNSRYTAPIHQSPVLDPSYEDPRGVPISAILFGGRRPRTVPLVVEAFDWKHGTFLGSIIGSERTSAAEGRVGMLQRDPFAMNPFCGYDMGDYFAHWLSLGDEKDGRRLPKIFFVNWFRRAKDGRYLWPGFGENARVLKWIIDRTNDRGDFQVTPIGNVPTKGAIDTSGLGLSDQDLTDLLRVDALEWVAEVESIKELYQRLGERVPKVLWEELSELESHLTNWT